MEATITTMEATIKTTTLNIIKKLLSFDKSSMFYVLKNVMGFILLLLAIIMICVSGLPREQNPTTGFIYFLIIMAFLTIIFPVLPSSQNTYLTLLSDIKELSSDFLLILKNKNF